MNVLAEMFELPLDEGHAHLPVTPCCGDVDAAGRTVSVDDDRERILRTTKR
jgi:hypothetical protein